VRRPLAPPDPGSDYSPRARSHEVHPPRSRLHTLAGEIQQRLARVTTSKAFIPEIDGLRFLAIITVVLFHLSTHLQETSGVAFVAPAMRDPVGWAVHTGGVGVFVFFSISGFVLALPFAAQRLHGARPVRLRDYFIRRLTRLEPPYLVTLLLFFAVQVVLLHKHAAELLPHLGASALYLHNIIYGTWSAINPVTWSLETEVQFYLLAPVFGLLFGIPGQLRRRAIIAGTIVLSLLVSGLFKEQLLALHLDRSLLAYAHYFLAGFLFADVYLDSIRGRERIGQGWDAAALAAILGILYVPHGWLHPPVVTLCTFVLFLAVFQATFVRRFFTNGWITVIGGMCYTIYLLHYPFIHFVLQRSASLSLTNRYWANYLLQAAIVLPLLLLVSALFFVLIEKPCMYKDWPQRLWAWLRGERNSDHQSKKGEAG
jgi:peptidoglycan/LPS O-acetylase OafA/YrhL